MSGPFGSLPYDPKKSDGKSVQEVLRKMRIEKGTPKHNPALALKRYSFEGKPDE